MQKSSFLGNIGVVSMWLKILLTQTLTRAYKDSPWHTHRISIFDWYYTIFIPIGRLFDAIIDFAYWYHAHTYTSDQHRFCPYWKSNFSLLKVEETMLFPKVEAYVCVTERPIRQHFIAAFIGVCRMAITFMWNLVVESQLAGWRFWMNKIPFFGIPRPRPLPLPQPLVARLLAVIYR